MGAGASAKESVVLDSAMASRDHQGKLLGVEYEVSLLRPKMKDVKLNEKYILRVGYEALVLLNNHEFKTPVTYFKYQDIISWGSTSKIFTFKVFGNAMSHHQPVAIVFSTSKGKEIEKITLSSVHALMADMDRVAVTKTDFNTLKAVLKGRPVDEVNNAEKKAAVATAVAASTDTSTNTPTDTSAPPEAVPVASSVEDTSGTTSSVDIVHGSLDVESGSLDQIVEAPKPLEGEEFLNTVEQFASTRSYTVHQAVQLMEMAMHNNTLDSFDRINFAVTLWKTSLNRDSFQLVVNVFQEPEDKENVIARVQATNTDKLSSSILRAVCSDVGGGLDYGTPPK